MHHNCPYFHDESLMPNQLREVLEERLEEFFLGTHQSANALYSSGTEELPGFNIERNQKSTDKQKARGMADMVQQICTLGKGIQNLSAGKTELSQRIAHDVIHQVGHAFASSNEANALEALERLERRIASFPPQIQYRAIEQMGLIGTRSRKLMSLCTDIRTDKKETSEALISELGNQLQIDLDSYRQNVYKSVIRAHLPKILESTLANSRKLSEIDGRMNDIFGISSGSWDLQHGSWEEIPWDVFRKSRELLDNDPSIRRLADLLGTSPGGPGGKQLVKKLIQTERSIRQSEQEYLGRSEVLGVEKGSEVQRVLPGEMAKLIDKDLETLFYRELLEEQLAVIKYRKNRRNDFSCSQTRWELREFDRPLGPMIICIDTSGSMSGWPEQIAKALSLALIQICWQQKRKLYAVLFSTELRRMDLSDMEACLPEFSAFFTREFRGGTDLRPALRQSFELMQSKAFRNADLLVVSDFRVPKAMLRETREMERVRSAGGNRIHALTIGQHPLIDQYNLFDSSWHYLISQNQKALGVSGLVELTSSDIRH